jgi:glycerol kinase
MSKGYIIAVDQSTSGTKAMVFDDNGMILGRNDLPHKQIISDECFVSHDPLEIYGNLIKCVSNVIDETGINKNEIKALGISNQRETALVWNKKNGIPVADAVVWHCSRAQKLCDELKDHEKIVQELTGLKLSPYFSAGKISYILKNYAEKPYDDLCAGTIDSWLIYKLTNKECFYTDFSNAARTQLFNINTLQWDEKLCDIFGIPMKMLPEVKDSDSVFGYTDFEGLLQNKIPVH